MKRILCLDGGGILGYLSARILQQLEQDLFGGPPEASAHGAGNHFVDQFDLIAGTSTGSILAAGLSLGLPLQRIIDLYGQRGRFIFERGIEQRLRSVARLFTPLYPDRGLAAELRTATTLENGQPATMRNLRKPTLIPTFDATRQVPVIFKSHDPEHPSDLDIPLFEIIKSSCSAPTYFPAHVLEYRRESHPRSGGSGLVQQHRSAMIDGGVIANNPTMCALAELFRGKLDSSGHHSRDAIVVSIGTSLPISDGLSPARARQMGLADWALPLIDIFMGGASLHVHGLAYRIVERDDNNLYVRFEILTERALSIDRAEAADIRLLEATVSDYLDDFPANAALHQQHLDNWYDYGSNLERLRKGLSGVSPVPAQRSKRTPWASGSVLP